MLLKIIPCFLLLFYGCREKNEDKINLIKSENYPRWLSSEHYSTNQSSGIAFIGLNEDGDKEFLIADDIGNIHRFTISDDTIFTFQRIKFSKNVSDFFSSFPKADFEDIAYDKTTGKVLLSVEGNNPDPKKFSGIFYLNFFNDDLNSDSVVSVEELNIQPEEKFKGNIRDNIAFEGLAVDNNFIYTGLEGFSEQGIFGDYTIIYIINKKNLKIVKEINTKSLGIITVCGLYSDKDYSLYGVDRNNKKFFHINFKNDLTIKNFILLDINTNIPKFSELDYVASIEAITMDDQQNIYLIDDPWRKFFIPAESVLNQLDSKSIKNFKNFIPVIYKYRIN